MPRIHTPAPGLFFRLCAYKSGRVIYSRYSPEPTVGNHPATDEFDDQYFTAATHPNYPNEFAFKSKATGKFLCYRHPNNMLFAEDWNTTILDVFFFTLDSGLGKHLSYFRIIPHGSDRALLSNNGVSYGSKGDFNDDQYFTLLYEDLIFDRVEFGKQQQAKIKDEPHVISSQELKNETDHDATLTFSFSETVHTTSLWEYTGGVKAGTSNWTTTLPAFLLKGEFKVALEGSFSGKNVETTVNSRTYTITVPVTAKTKQRIVAKMSVRRAEMECPFTVYWRSSKTAEVATTEGIWRGITSYDMTTSVTPI
ncbi:hypothetical protein DXG01_006363 [Tephrocybe rancida]|nr:hypothetical protein DXG01_006363 [Tephrocybe rancida]